MSEHIFVDESKDRDYLMVAAIITPDGLQAARRQIRGLVLKGQRRVHMKKESEPRKRAIAALIVDIGLQAVVFHAARDGRAELEARAACLAGLVADADNRGADRLILEQDDSLRRWDLQRLIELTREAGCRDSLYYEHRRASEEPLLAIPDAIAWCWAKGGDWRRRIEPAVSAVRQV